MDHLLGARHVTRFGSFDPITYSEGGVILFYRWGN